MQAQSVYCVQCLCGHLIESESEILCCPVCERQIVIEWAADEKDPDSEPAEVRTAA
jgi:hypothetical protein